MIALLIVLSMLGMDFPMCQTEDSTSCVWVADVQGNGHGRSFVDIGGKQLWLG